MAKINKRDIVGRLIKVPDNGRRPFWAKEMTLLKLLLEKYPIEFVELLRFPQQFNSIAVLLSGPVATDIKSQYWQWRHKPKSIDEKYELQSDKIGEDVNITRKPKTIRSFLNE